MADGVYVRGFILFNDRTDARRRVVVLEGLRRGALHGLGLSQAASLDRWDFDGIQLSVKGMFFRHAQLKTYLEELKANGTVLRYCVDSYELSANARIASD